uniref:SMP domain-containing protein n=1 Tax=Oryza punctata TaxID=4537 RepID=A0A0E0KIZ2_ORYPU
MSQGQPRRPPPEDRPVMYGDVFDVTGELAGQPVAPRDAAMLQSAEEVVLGQTQKGGPAAVMQSAAAINARAGHVGRAQVTGATADEGVTVTETELPGRRVVTESVAGQVVGQLVTPPRVVLTKPSGALDDEHAVTIGRAMEAVAAATAAAGKPVDQSDAAAIQAAEMRATGCTSVTVPGGVAAAAQAAADHNAAPAARDEDRIKLRDVLTEARGKLPADKAATREDAERVVSAEVRNRPDMATTPGGVADAVTAAARLNQERP